MLHTYETALRGFSVRLPDAAAALARQPGVREVVPDVMLYPTLTQSNAPYNLDRIDQRDLPLSTTYSYDDTARA